MHKKQGRNVQECCCYERPSKRYHSHGMLVAEQINQEIIDMLVNSVDEQYVLPVKVSERYLEWAQLISINPRSYCVSIFMWKN